MKRLDELGVSPAPWKVYDKYYVSRSDTGFVANCSTPANASLIAAAPDLYDIVWEMVHERCRDCKSLDGDKCLMPENSCFKRWRKALEKAGG